MSEIVKCKLKYVTEKGTKLRSSVTLEYKDDRIYFVKSPYGMKDTIKSFGGAKWHGFDKEPRKVWSIDDSFRNEFNLQYMQGNNVFAWFDRPLQVHEYTRPLMNHQKEMTDSGLTYKYQIWAAEMGCVDGDAIVHANRAGKGFQIKLADLYQKFHGGLSGKGKQWDLSIPTKVRSLKGNSFGQHQITNVLDKGIKDIVEVSLTNGCSICVTPDHEFYDADLNLIQAVQLKPKDKIIVSGLMEDTEKWDVLKKNNPGNYIVLSCRNHPKAGRRGTMHEHVLVMEKYLGRYLVSNEVVHHINGQKDDNRFENLQLMDDSEHKALHAKKDLFVNLSGGRKRVDFEPTLGTIKTVLSKGTLHVYDLVMADPYRNFVANGFVVKNCGKTLSAQEVIERAGVPHWYWIGPKTSLPNIKREFKKWGFDETCATIDYMTYERLVRVMAERSPGDPIPNGVIFDESSRLKTPTSQRSKAALKLANLIRSEYSWDGYVILMSGTPAPKRPTDHWSSCEIAWPGFLREGSIKALERRLAFQVQETFDSGTFWKTIGWRDDEKKCNKCGLTFEEGPHDRLVGGDDFHPFVKTKNEVAYMFKRLKGLMGVWHKEDCLTLPDKRYRKVECKPKASLLRVGKTIVESAQNAMIGMTLLRELSDGFQYRDVEDGTKPCNHCTDGTVDEWFSETKTYQDISLLDGDLVSRLEKRRIKCPKCHGTCQMPKTKRVTKEIPCPKEPALRALLEECEETGRILVFAGFTGSVDRCVNICHKEGWAVVRCDGRGFQVTLADGTLLTDDALDFWADLEENPRVAFVAHPESGGMSLTLVEARMAVYWSNSFKPEYRIQSEDRIHRKGMDENLGCTIVDLIHLPTDERVVDIIRENRKLELMTMGKITDGIKWGEL